MADRHFPKTNCSRDDGVIPIGIEFRESPYIFVAGLS